MRATIRNYIASEKARREEEGEKGFSLIELIIVVVILGILVAIAIPLFANIQTQAQTNALKAAAANGATAASSEIAANNAAGAGAAAASAGDPAQGITVTYANTTGTVDGVCATATGGTGWPAAETAGPGC